MPECPVSECAGREWFPACEDRDVCDLGDLDKCSICGTITEYIKYLVRGPANACSFIRYFIDPIRKTSYYKRYAKCKVDLLASLIGVLGAIISVYSFMQVPWLNDVKSCYDDNFECTAPWWFLSTYLFAKTIILNTMGVVTNVALVFAVQFKNIDCVYLWLSWKTLAIALSTVSMFLMGVFSFFISQDLSKDILFEFLDLAANLLAFIFIYVIFEQLSNCSDDNEAGGDEGGAGEDGDNEYLLRQKKKNMAATASKN